MDFYLPTKLFSNIDSFSIALEKLGEKFLIITGKSSAHNGSLDELTKILNKYQKKYEIFNETIENPPKELLELILKRHGKDWDVIIGLGGGSPMDTAKAIAILCKNNISVEELYELEKYNTASKIVCIPTTAGTGSEVTQYSVLTINGIKKGFKHEKIFPTISLLEPKYSLTLPKDLKVTTYPYIIKGVAVLKNDYIPDGEIKILWSYNLNLEVKSKPAAYNNILFIASTNGNILALNNGNLLWQYRLPFIITGHLTITDDSLIATCWDNNIYSLDFQGNLLWKVPLDSDITLGVAWDGIKIYALSDDGYLYELKDGKIINQYKVGRWPIAGPFISLSGKVYSIDAMGFLWIDNEKSTFIGKVKNLAFFSENPVIPPENSFVLLDDFGNEFIFQNSSVFKNGKNVFSSQSEIIDAVLGKENIYLLTSDGMVYFIDRKNFNILYIIKDTEGEYLEKETNNPEVIKELLEVFTKYDVIEYDGSANYGDYHIRFSNTDTLEYLEINTRKDNSLTIRTRTYVVNKDDDEKIIKHGYITSHNNYRIKNSELNVDAIDNFIDKIE